MKRLSCSGLLLGLALSSVILINAGCTAIESFLSQYDLSTENGEQVTVNPEESIGQATMKADGTIVLQLRAESGDGTVGDAQFIYPPDDSNYDMILEHVGGLEPGESKPVPPWPDG